MKKALFTLALLVGLSLSANEQIPLWQNDQPGKAATEDITSQGDCLYVKSVKTSTLEFYPAPNCDSAPCVIVCPGGAYTALAYDKEGTNVAKWLNTQGFSAAVLKYRVPNMKNEALFDAQRAMAMLRYNASKFNIDPKKIGIMGFSAGGNLAARLSSHYADKAYPKNDEIDKMNIRPDFTILIYPAYGGNGVELSNDLKVDKQTPPCFIVQTQDDRSFVGSATSYYLACSKAGVACDLHLFSKGGHGYGINVANRGALQQYPELLAQWLKNIKK